MRLSTIIALALLLGACPRTAEPPAKEHVVLGLSALRISQAVFVALDRGVFAKHGLDVEVKKFDTAQPLADELAAGRIDAGGYVAFPILFGREGEPLHIRVLTAIVEDEKHPISYLLVKKGSGLRGVASLKGKKIGILPTVAYRKWLEAILQHDGLAVSDVSIVPIAPALEVETLAGGGVDALFTGDPMATAALAREVAEPATTTPDVPRVLGDPFLFGTFAITDALATKRPAAAKALRESLDEAIDLLAATPSLGPAAMAPSLREPERAFASRYPPTRYFKSTEVTSEQLGRALELVGTKAAVADLRAP